MLGFCDIKKFPFSQDHPYSQDFLRIIMCHFTNNKHLKLLTHYQLSFRSFTDHEEQNTSTLLINGNGQKNHILQPPLFLKKRSVNLLQYANLGHFTFSTALKARTLKKNCDREKCIFQNVNEQCSKHSSFDLQISP